ncbi:hypothetical protein ACOMHN_047343 [Nucella lapillus]
METGTKRQIKDTLCQRTDTETEKRHIVSEDGDWGKETEKRHIVSEDVDWDKETEKRHIVSEDGDWDRDTKHS